MNSKFQNTKKRFQKKFGKHSKWFEGGVAFWSFAPMGSHVNENENHSWKLKNAFFSKLQNTSGRMARCVWNFCDSENKLKFIQKSTRNLHFILWCLASLVLFALLDDSILFITVWHYNGVDNLSQCTSIDFSVTHILCIHHILRNMSAFCTMYMYEYLIMEERAYKFIIL